MLRDALSQLGPFLGFCDHPIRLAELALLALLCVLIGCCCGGLLTALILSPWIRTILTTILLNLLEADGRPRVRELTGQDRLQPYRG
jgi:hypothetical protein